MPLYDWTCLNCEENFRELLKFDEFPSVCPKCENVDKSKFKKLLTAPTLRTSGGLSSMTTRHTTSEYFGPHGRMGKQEYFPDEIKRKQQEQKKKQESKGATVAVTKPLKK